MWHAAIAHELRTPVTILRGRLQGLAEGVFQPDESQFRSLLAQVEGLSRLIEDLRVLSLSDNARLDVRRARTDVVAEVHSVMTLVDPQFRAAGFVLELEPAARNTTRTVTRHACARPCWHCWRMRAATPARARCGLPCTTRPDTCRWRSRTKARASTRNFTPTSSLRSCAPTARAPARAAAAGWAWLEAIAQAQCFTRLVEHAGVGQAASIHQLQQAVGQDAVQCMQARGCRYRCAAACGFPPRSCC